MAQAPRILKNFNLFVQGRGSAGKAEKVSLPDIEINTEDHRAGGMDTPLEIDMGLNKMVAKFEIAEPDPNILGLVGQTDSNAARVVARGSFVRDTDGSRTPVVAEMVGRLKKSGFAEWEAGKKANNEFEMSVNYYRLTVGGVEVYEIDVENMVRRINGVDQLAGIRADIGV